MGWHCIARDAACPSTRSRPEYSSGACSYRRPTQCGLGRCTTRLPDAKPIHPSSPPASPAPPRKRQRTGTVNAPITLSSDAHNEDYTEPEPRADDHVKVVCASKLYNNMPFRQKVIKDTYIFLRQMRPDLVPWTASIWDTNTARDGTVLGGCMFAQVDPAKAYKQNKLVKSPGIVLEDGIYACVGCMLVHELLDILRMLEKA
ncbi:uncharacterized protein J4E79_011402 [Alternaria viburni]|uniref:uncharacterized protein n=1 Tax=Alternaria viburni TaxID=566460 RepID=UPI0020C4105A|nr:uncharacterized protein J4E79_011402 [Alternaria viburni]KAI4642786.1 hypothetical protein J4E79_011402 [Alternaria viburni]